MNIKTTSKFLPALGIMAFLVSGCATTGKEDADSMTTKFGPKTLLQQPVDVPDIISIITEGADSSRLALDNDAAGQASAVETFNKQLDKALKCFYSSSTDTSVLQTRRNRIQDRLLMASNDACENYKTVLKRKQADRNFQYGVASIGLGAAGAVSTVANTARVFSALAGATAGARAEYNRDYFADLAAQVITKAITNRRKEILASILDGQGKGLLEYSLESAIADAIIYHGACSLIGGLEYADGAVASTGKDATLGLDVMRATQKTANEIAQGAAVKK